MENAKTPANSKTNKFLIVYAIGIVSLGAFAYMFSDLGFDASQLRALSGHYTSDVAFVDLPQVSLNVASSKGDHPGKLRMDISLEVEKKNARRLEGYLPRITEKISAYASQLDYEQISQPEAAQRIRKYLLQQANEAGSPVPIVNLVFRQYILI